MRRYFFHIERERGRNEDPWGTVLPGPGEAMLHAVTMCAEVGCSDGFRLRFAVCVQDEYGAAIGRVSVITPPAAKGCRDA